MSSLDSLMLQGIRTFSPDKPQVIKFFPITLILGHNGAGKTTIIESLRYICSGEFPPNTYKGKTWLHDPMLMQKKVKCVRAQVKLKFRDVFKNISVATKNLELIVSNDRSGNTKTSIRTIDFTIKVTDSKTEEVKSLVSTKCAEVESLMLDHLGVSKAVLTNVIFCHQEESNWPLSESKVLKEKFDQIFGSAGYVKALKKIKDIRKSYLESVKLLEKDLIYLQELTEQFDKVERNRDLKKDELAELSREAINYENEMKPLEEQFAQLCEREQGVSDLGSSISKLQGFVEAEQFNQKTLREKIVDLYQGDETELNEYIEQFRNKVQIKAQKTNEFEQAAIKIHNQIQALSLKRESLQEQRSELLVTNKEHTNLLARRLAYVKDLYEQLGLKTDTDMQDWQKTIKDVIRKMEKDEKDLQEQVTSIENKLKQVDQCATEKTNVVMFLEQSISLSQNSIKKLENEISSIRVSIAKSGTADTRLDELDTEICKCRSSLDKHMSNNELGKLETEIKEQQRLRASLKSDINSLLGTYKDMQADREVRRKINDLNTLKREKKDLINSLAARNSDFLDEVSDKITEPTFSFHDELRQRLTTIQQLVEDARERKSQAEKAFLINEMDVQNKEEKVRLLSKTISDKNAQIQSFAGDRSLQSLLDECGNKITALKRRLFTCNQKRSLFQHALDLVENEQQCPICASDINDASVKARVCDNLSKKLHTMPNLDQALERQMQEEERRRIRITQLQQKQQELAQEEIDLEKQESLLSRARIDLKLKKEQQDELSEKVREYEQRESTMRCIESDSLLYDQANHSVQDADRKLRVLQAQTNTCSQEFTSIEEVEVELTTKREASEDAEYALEKCNRKRTLCIETIDSLKNKLMRLEQDKLTLERQQQSISQSHTELKTKSDELDQLRNREATNETTLEEERAKLRFVKEQREQIAEQLQKIQSQTSKNSVRLQNVHTRLNEYNERDRELSSKYDKNDLQKLKDELEQQQLQMELLRKQEQKAQTKAIDSREQIQRAKAEEQDLMLNLQLLQSETKLQKLKEEQSALQAKLGAQDLTTLLKLKEQLQEQLSSYKQKRQVSLSCKAPVESQLKELEKELKLKKFENIRNKLNSALVDFHARSVVCEDLNKYYVALDKSVITFHHRKMKEINQLIHRFWKQTYRGKDIDTVRIISEEEPNKSADSRKSYNYRVVMVKSGVEMDMRGRCSAGQKVLACLIIRLALAEIFCINCGVLALDEPTTNLDKESILSFSEAIKELVNSHSKYKNFQIVIITHDEEFLRCLDDENEYYYQITQDEDGHSCIEKHSLRERD